MSSDRGTVQRSPVTGTGPQTGWQAPTTPACWRLPTAPRERKPVLAALAVLLILGGALGAGYLVTKSSKQVQAIEITRQIGAGQRIPLSAMQQVPVPAGTQVGYVAWVYASQVTRYYAAVTIPPGTLLNKSMVATTNRSTAGRDIIGLALKDGQLPRGLQAGDHVDIFFVQNSTQVNGCPGTPGSLLTGNAIVLGITAPSVTAGSQDADVQVAVSPADAGAVACAAANGIAGLHGAAARRARRARARGWHRHRGRRPAEPGRPGLGLRGDRARRVAIAVRPGLAVAVGLRVRAGLRLAQPLGPPQQGRLTDGADRGGRGQGVTRGYHHGCRAGRDLAPAGAARRVRPGLAATWCTGCPARTASGWIRTAACSAWPSPRAAARRPTRSGRTCRSCAAGSTCSPG